MNGQAKEQTNEKQINKQGNKALKQTNTCVNTFVLEFCNFEGSNFRNGSKYKYIFSCKYMRVKIYAFVNIRVCKCMRVQIYACENILVCMKGHVLSKTTWHCFWVMIQ
jgi:hypothetical protein